LEPDELRQMIEDIRDIAIMLGNSVQKPAACEREIIEFVRGRFKK
jgi:sialic acid synthase SpsE